MHTKYVKQQNKALRTEVVAWSKGVRGDAEKPVVISGPSGVGKGTLINMLMKEFPSMFGFSVSHTTRAPRGMEKNGVHYHFTERSVMEKDIKDVKFLEFASVHGNLYGTSIEAVEAVSDSGKVFLLFTVLLIVIIPNDALKVAHGMLIIPDSRMEFHLGGGYMGKPVVNP